MTDTRSRLEKCFVAVFPQLGVADIAGASVLTVKGWDSLATVTLLTVLEEEFGIQIDAEDLDHFFSFERILDYLQHDPQMS